MKIHDLIELRIHATIIEVEMQHFWIMGCD